MNKRRQNHGGGKLRHLHFARTKGIDYVYFRPPGVKGKGSTTRLFSKPGTREFLDEYYAALNGTPAPVGIEKRNNRDGTWNAAIAGYMGTSAYTTLARQGAYNSAIAHLRETVGDLPMSSFRPYMVAELVDAKVREGKSGAANDLLTVLRKVVAFAVSREWVVIDLLGGIKKQRQKNPEGYRAWEPQEIDRWRAAYPDPASTPRLAFEIVYATGLRGRSDATRLGWQHITRDAGTLWVNGSAAKTPFIVQKTKTKLPPQPLLAPELLACLAHCPEVIALDGSSTRPFLINPNTGDAYDPDTFSAHWKRWAEQAGMAADFRPHGGRKSIVADATTFGVASTDGMKLTGHRTEAVYRHYGASHDQRVSAERAAQAVVAGRQKRRAA